MACGPDVLQNVEKSARLVQHAAGSGAQIICLQELFSSRYFPQTVDVSHYTLACEMPDQTVATMQRIAAERRIVLIVPVYECARPGIYFNTAVVIDADGTISGKFRKVHIPEGPQYLEKYYFTPGNLGYPVFKTAYAKIAVGICWDEWFPEVARIFGLKGAQIIFYPSAIGSEPDHPQYSSREAWETVIRSHAITNGLFVAAVNRVGVEDQMQFYGGSFISNPFGEVLARGDNQNDQVVLAALDMQQIKDFRDIFQFFRDRRPETYNDLLKLMAE
jgi:N-carbamoylputrescine amidase